METMDPTADPRAWDPKALRTKHISIAVPLAMATIVAIYFTTRWDAGVPSSPPPVSASITAEDGAGEGYDVSAAAKRIGVWFVGFAFFMAQLFFGICRPQKRDIKWINGKWGVDYRFKWGVASRRLRWSAKALGTFFNFVVAFWGGFQIVDAVFFHDVDETREHGRFIQFPIPYEKQIDSIKWGRCSELVFAFSLLDLMYLLLFEPGVLAVVSRALHLAASAPLFLITDHSTMIETLFFTQTSLAALLWNAYEWHSWCAFQDPQGEVNSQERIFSIKYCNKMLAPTALWCFVLRGVLQPLCLVDAAHFHVYGLPLANSLKNAPPPNTMTPTLAWFMVAATTAWLACLPSLCSLIFGALRTYIDRILMDFERVTGHMKDPPPPQQKAAAPSKPANPKRTKSAKKTS